MFVEAENRFGHFGYPTLRFDMSGCGDSTGSALENDTEREVLDILEAARFFMNKAELKGLILFGISRGARLCFSAMANQSIPLSGMILLSAPISSNSAALRQFSARLKEYLHKLRDPGYLRKLLSGRANLPQIWRTLIVALQFKQRHKPMKSKIINSKCPVLFLYGGADPIAKASARYYMEMCRENELSYDHHIVAGANHSFFHYKWKEEIFNVSIQWLEQAFG
jgi:pimeloyl-ACP methyl ester carboxylesterase